MWLSTHTLFRRERRHSPLLRSDTPGRPALPGREPFSDALTNHSLHPEWTKWTKWTQWTQWTDTQSLGTLHKTRKGRRRPANEPVLPVAARLRRPVCRLATTSQRGVARPKPGSTERSRCRAHTPHVLLGRVGVGSAYEQGVPLRLSQQ